MAKSEIEIQYVQILILSYIFCSSFWLFMSLSLIIPVYNEGKYIPISKKNRFKEETGKEISEYAV